MRPARSRPDLACNVSAAAAVEVDKCYFVKPSPTRARTPALWPRTQDVAPARREPGCGRSSPGAINSRRRARAAIAASTAAPHAADAARTIADGRDRGAVKPRQVCCDDCKSDRCTDDCRAGTAIGKSKQAPSRRRRRELAKRVCYVSRRPPTIAADRRVAPSAISKKGGARCTWTGSARRLAKEPAHRARAAGRLDGVSSQPALQRVDWRSTDRVVFRGSGRRALSSARA